jgi:hypothetical protein
MLGLLGFAFMSYLNQMPDSSLETTRVFWRKKYWNATDKEAYDPRPWKEVLSEREVITEGE